MATLQKLRSNKITSIAIGVGMLAFIGTGAVEFFSSKGPETEVAKLNGKSLEYNKLNEMVDRYVDAMETLGQIEPGKQLNSEEMAMLREQVYQNYIQQQLLEEECEKLDIKVTEKEFLNIIKSGMHPLLARTPFANQQGQFDYTVLQQFLNSRKEALNNPQMAEQREYIERYYRLWSFIEEEIKKDVLKQKYQALLAGLTITNPVSVKAHFDGRTNETDIVLAQLPYSSIEDKDVKIEESELQKKYDSYKETYFKQFNETRDIKYIDVLIKASDADRQALNQEMDKYAAELQKAGANLETVVSQAQSLVPYASLPMTRNAMPMDVQTRIDSMQEGTQCAPYYNVADNSMNIVRLVKKVTLPDSIEVRQIAAINSNAEAAKKSADSIFTALQNGANFDSIAKKYNQPGTKTWITSQMYDGAKLGDSDKKMIETALNATVGSYNKVELEGGTLIMEVTDRRNQVSKYDVAIIKRTLDFTNETANNTYNELSNFLTQHKTIADIEKNQKGNIMVRTSEDLEPMTYVLDNIRDSREVVKWVYNEDRKEGDISEIFYCGDNRDHLVVACLTAVHPAGYRTLADERVKQFINGQVLKDKKAAMLQEKMKGAKSLADVAKMDKVVMQDTVKHITFNAMTNLMSGAENSISGAASAAPLNKFVSGVRGENGVYAFQVIAKNKTAEQYDEKAETKTVVQQNAMLLQQMFNSDMRNPNSAFYKSYKNAKLEDNRHLFY